METPFQYRKESRPASQQPKTLFFKIEILIASNKHFANNFLWVAAQSNIVDFINQLRCFVLPTLNSSEIQSLIHYWLLIYIDSNGSACSCLCRDFPRYWLISIFYWTWFFFNSSYFSSIFEESVLSVLLKLSFWVSARSCKIEYVFV